MDDTELQAERIEDREKRLYVAPIIDDTTGVKFEIKKTLK